MHSNTNLTIQLQNQIIKMSKVQEQMNEEMEGKEEYDDKGVLCRYTEKEGWQPIEECCEKCGFTCENCDCEEEEEEHPAHKFFEERDCAYCRVFFDQGKDICKECGFDLNSWNKEEE